MAEADFSDAERVFIARMAPHIEAGLSFEDAAAAVVADDERIYLELHGRNRNEIVAALSSEVYHRIRESA